MTTFAGGKIAVLACVRERMRLVFVSDVLAGILKDLLFPSSCFYIRFRVVVILISMRRIEMITLFAAEFLHASRLDFLQSHRLTSATMNPPTLLI